MAKYPKKNNWIQTSIKHEGRVRDFVYVNFGDKAFDRQNNIKPAYLDYAKRLAEIRKDKSMVDAIDLAKTLRGFKHGGD